GAVACRILDELWNNDKIGTPSAVWLLGRVLEGPDFTKDDKIEAAGVLAHNASKLFPDRLDPDQNWIEWPSIVRDGWPSDLPLEARGGLVYMAIKAILSREPDFWTDQADPYPVTSLWNASSADEDLNAIAAFALTKLLSVPNFIAFSDFADAEEEERIRALAEHHDTAKWLEKLYDQLEPWAAGEELTHPEEHSIPSVMGGTGSETLAPQLGEGPAGMRTSDSTQDVALAPPADHASVE
ncbi:MAG: hypothetical protein ABWY20_12500, partial [Mycobacterium sp.]